MPHFPASNCFFDMGSVAGDYSVQIKDGKASIDMLRDSDAFSTDIDSWLDDTLSSRVPGPAIDDPKAALHIRMFHAAWPNHSAQARSYSQMGPGRALFQQPMRLQSRGLNNSVFYSPSALAWDDWTTHP
jgi:hypothetical protein